MPSRRQADRARQSRRLLLRAERRIDAAVLSSIDAWLTAVRFHLFRELGAPGSVQAAAFPHGPHIVDAAVQASYGEWRRQLDRQVIPSVSIEFSEAFQQARRRDPLNSYRYQQQYLEEVSDRLKIWPEGAFEDIRPELMEALAEGESIDEIRDRIGRVLNIDARTRAIRATIHEVEQRLEDPDLPPNARRVLNARRRELWNEHDDSLGEWQWKARRIARTEAHGAVEAGKLASAMARAERDPSLRMWKRWLSTEDTRVRATHRVADGQTVPLTDRFRVGGFLLLHPGDPITVAPHETINCRCSTLYYDDDELQDELQGPDGSMGEIRPGGVRIGPDDPDEADRVIAEVAEAEGLSRPARLGQRGEDHGQTTPPAPEPVALTDEREQLPPPDRPTNDLTRLSDDQLLDEMQRANDTNNEALWEATDAEWNRRYGLEAADTDFDESLGEPTQPDATPNLPTGGGDDEEDWQARQDALDVDFHGERLEPHEVEFVERFRTLGHRIDWIPTDEDHPQHALPTNDFLWLDHDYRLAVELKSPREPKYATIRRMIRDAVKKAAARGVVKENFVIDLGDHDLDSVLRSQLETYNELVRGGFTIRRLWVMARGELHEIQMRPPRS